MLPVARIGFFWVESNAGHAVCVPCKRVDALSSLPVPDLGGFVAAPGGEEVWVCWMESNAEHALCVPCKRHGALSSLPVPDLGGAVATAGGDDVWVCWVESNAGHSTCVPFQGFFFRRVPPHHSAGLRRRVAGFHMGKGNEIG